MKYMNAGKGPLKQLLDLLLGRASVTIATVI